jgi:hypothetical protein
VRDAPTALEVLKAALEEHGEITDDDRRAASAASGLPEAAVYGVSSFYDDLLAPRGARHVRVCTGTACFATDGGALVFYTDAAELTITPPAGSTLHLTVPGFYTPTQALTRATVSYLDQFAAYDPPTAAGTPRIIADYSAITGKN